MKLSLSDILSQDFKYRLNLINSISGYKSVHLIGTSSDEGTNLAIFNSVVHIGSDPPLMGFIMRPLSVERHTYDNILKSKYYTLNHVHKSFLKQAHYTSTKLDKDESEFAACNLEEQYIDGFKAPFVKESTIKIGLKLKEDITIEANGTHLIIGEIQLIDLDEDYLELDGKLNLQKANDVCVTGLNQYSAVSKFISYPYARKSEMPDFKAKERADNVVFDKATQSYNSSLLPYGTNIGAPSIKTTQISAWKNNSISSFNHAFENKIENLKEDYKKLIDEYQMNDLVYKSKMGFEPIIGEVYHLYARENEEEHFLSMIPPDSWSKKHLGSFKLNNDKIWRKVNLENSENDGE